MKVFSEWCCALALMWAAGCARTAPIARAPSLPIEQPSRAEGPIHITRYECRSGVESAYADEIRQTRRADGYLEVSVSWQRPWFGRRSATGALNEGETDGWHIVYADADAALVGFSGYSREQLLLVRADGPVVLFEELSWSLWAIAPALDGSIVLPGVETQVIRPDGEVRTVFGRSDHPDSAIRVARDGSIDRGWLKTDPGGARLTTRLGRSAVLTGPLRPCEGDGAVERWWLSDSNRLPISFDRDQVPRLHDALIDVGTSGRACLRALVLDFTTDLISPGFSPRFEAVDGALRNDNGDVCATVEAPP